MRRIRLPIATLAAVLFAGLPVAVLAHAELVSSQPKQDAVLEVPPSAVVLTFDSELDPDTSLLEVTDAGGASVGTGGVDLDIAERNVLSAAVDIADDGAYEVAWTAGSIDGHVETGTFAFRVGMPAADTALPAPPSSLVLIGTVLLVLALALSARQVRTSSR